MKSRRLIILFGIVALLQAAVPVYMAWHWEDVLQTGRTSYWLTAPVDPYDAFKGRYIDLNFKESKGQILNSALLEHGQTAYAIIIEDAEGRALISGVTDKMPVNEQYIKVKVSYVEGSIVHFILPFKRYYLPEELAPVAERVYQQSAGKNGVAAVRIKDGYGVIEKLYVDDKEIYEYLPAPK